MPPSKTIPTKLCCANCGVDARPENRILPRNSPSADATPWKECFQCSALTMTQLTHNQQRTVAKKYQYNLTRQAEWDSDQPRPQALDRQLAELYPPAPLTPHACCEHVAEEQELSKKLAIALDDMVVAAMAALKEHQKEEDEHGRPEATAKD